MLSVVQISLLNQKTIKPHTACRYHAVCGKHKGFIMSFKTQFNRIVNDECDSKNKINPIIS